MVSRPLTAYLTQPESTFASVMQIFDAVTRLFKMVYVVIKWKQKSRLSLHGSHTSGPWFHAFPHLQLCPHPDNNIILLVVCAVSALALIMLMALFMHFKLKREHGKSSGSGHQVSLWDSTAAQQNEEKTSFNKHLSFLKYIFMQIMNNILEVTQWCIDSICHSL